MDLQDENYKLQLKLDNLKKEHATEVEYLREELEIKEKEFKEQFSKLKEESKAKEGLKNEKIQALTEELNSLREEYDSTTEQMEKLRLQVEMLKNARSASVSSSYSEYEGLKESQRTLRSQLAEKDELLTTQTEKIRALGEEIRDCRNVVTELSEVVEGKDSVIKELSSRVKDLEKEKEEECGVLQNEVLGLKEEIKSLRGATDAGGEGGGGKSVGGASRGNSLFSEVEERRLKVENELTRLRNMVKRLTDENRNLQIELERGDSNSAAITTQLDVITKSENELALEIKKDKSESLTLFDSYRDRFEFLRSEYTRKLQQYKSNSSSHQSSELETLRQERDSLLLLRISLERDINELRRELRYNKHLRVNAEANTKILKAKLDHAKQNSNNSEQSSSVSVPDSNANVLDLDNAVPDSVDTKDDIKRVTTSTPVFDNKNKLSIRQRKNEQECNQQ